MKKLIVLLVLVLLVVAGLVYYKKWRNNMLHKKLPELVFLKSDSLYRITYDAVDVDEVAGEILIKNLQLIPDSTYKKPTDSTLPHNLIKVTVPEVHITGVQTDAAVIDKQILASKVKLTSPVVTMYNNKRGAKANDNQNDTTPTTDKLYQVLLRGLDKIKVDTILITDANYHICQWADGDTIFSGSKINAQLHHINISDSTSTDKSRVLFAENASLDVNNIVIRTKRGLYKYTFNDIQLLSAERSFAVKKLNITPLLSEAAFMKASKYQTDRMDFDLYNLLFKNVNVQEILNGNLITDELIIKNAQFKIFRDKSYPDKKDNKVGHYPHQDLLRIPIDVALKKVVVQSGSIEYKEKNPQTAKSGVVVFDDISASLLNVNNRKDNNGIMTVNFNTRFLNKVPLSATLQFYMKDKNGKFTVNGSMKQTDATVFNPLSKPMALVEINSGNIQSLDFNLICDDYKAKGIVKLLYNDLKIKILKQEELGTSEYKSKKVMSLIANLTIPDANPKKKEAVRIVTVNHARDTQRSMFNLIWKAIFEGAQKTVGIDGKLGAKK